MDPRESAAAGVGVVERVGGVLQRFFEGDKRVAAGAEHFQDLRHLVGVQLAGMEEQDLRDFVAGDFDGALFEKLDDGGQIGHVIVDDPGLDRGVRVDQRELVVGIVKRYGRDLVAAGEPTQVIAEPIVFVEDFRPGSNPAVFG